MKTIDIQKHTGLIEVLDDPEYCELVDYECDYLEYDRMICNLYLVLLIQDMDDYFLKCQQCKTAYQKAINERPNR